MTDMTTSNPGSPVYSDFAGDDDFAELLEMFVDAMAEKRALLEEAYQSQDWDQLQVTSHQLKGSGGGYGFPGLTAIAARLEQACKDDDEPTIKLEFAAILDYLSRVSA